MRFTLNKFISVQYHIVNYMHNVVQGFLEIFHP